jgi:phycocyanobilin:ferredoxin oxidoreductase
MSEIWDVLIDCKDTIIDVFDEHCEEIEEPGMSQFNKPDSGWINRVWKSTSVRRAHIDVVDARDTRGLWMMHVCVFPQLDNDAPVYGFDVIAGKNKMTGAFLDYSPMLSADHPMCEGYLESVQDFVPKKQRTLPEWATNIFSEGMVAAGNVNTTGEAKDIVNLALMNLEAYFAEIDLYAGVGDPVEVAAAQNYYCENQQQNPHTPKTMKSLGLDEAEVDLFCKDMLFPKII